MDNNNVHKLTRKGIEKLKSELEHLKTTERERNREALKEARAMGDLSENADYDAARDEQALIEARIKEIEHILKNAELIKDDGNNNQVNIGKTVTMQINGEDPKQYSIVGSLEADPFDNKISNESPIGKAVLGMKKGDSKIVRTQSNRELNITIVDVK